MAKTYQIHLTSFIQAPVERVFDLARSIDVHKKSMVSKGEEAVSGTVCGLIQLGESVTWKAKHLGKTRYFQSKITAMVRPVQFTDQMAKGDFREFEHHHYFKSLDNGTIMIDVLEYSVPYGFIGRLVNWIYLYKYLGKLLEGRNLYIKQVAESEKWKQFISPQPIFAAHE